MLFLPTHPLPWSLLLCFSCFQFSPFALFTLTCCRALRIKFWFSFFSIYIFCFEMQCAAVACHYHDTNLHSRNCIYMIAYIRPHIFRYRILTVSYHKDFCDSTHKHTHTHTHTQSLQIASSFLPIYWLNEKASLFWCFLTHIHMPCKRHCLSFHLACTGEPIVVNIQGIGGGGGRMITGPRIFNFVQQQTQITHHNILNKSQRLQQVEHKLTFHQLIEL